jgi:hypothetical protein
MAVCGCLIAGSTYALFTSKSDVNIAVTSGNVKVVATVNDFEGHSLNAYTTNTVKDDYIEFDGDDSRFNGYYKYTDYEAKDNIVTFANGGTATLKNNTLTLLNITPGDKVNFGVDITNSSNVSIYYRIKIVCSGTEDSTDNGYVLMSGLTYKVGDVDYSGISSYTSEWIPLSANKSIDDLTMSVELPIQNGNKYKGKSCVITYTIEAVQGNANIDNSQAGTNKISLASDILNGTSSDESQTVALTESQSVVLTEDVTLNKPLTVSDGADIDLVLNGNNITLTSDDGISVETGSTLNIIGSEDGSSTGTIIIGSQSSSSNGGTGSVAAITLENKSSTNTASAAKTKLNSRSAIKTLASSSDSSTIDGDTTVVNGVTTLNLNNINIEFNYSLARKAAIYAYSQVADGIVINVGEGTKIKANYGNNYCVIQAAKNTIVNYDGAEVNAYGYGSVFVTGRDNGSSGCVFNFISGTMNLHDSVTGIECNYFNNAYVTGGTINVFGDSTAIDSGAIALGSSYGGTIEMSGGTINLEATNDGQASAASTYFRYSENQDSTVSFTGNSTINVQAIYGCALAAFTIYSGTISFGGNEGDNVQVNISASKDSTSDSQDVYAEAYAAYTYRGGTVNYNSGSKVTLTAKNTSSTVYGGYIYINGIVNYNTGSEATFCAEDNGEAMVAFVYNCTADGKGININEGSTINMMASSGFVSYGYIYKNGNIVTDSSALINVYDYVAEKVTIGDVSDYRNTLYIIKDDGTSQSGDGLNSGKITYYKTNSTGWKEYTRG